MYIETAPYPAAPRPRSCCARATGTARPCESARCLNLSHWPAEHVEGLRGVLKGGVVIPPATALLRRAFAAAWPCLRRPGATRAIGLDKIIGPRPRARPTPRAVDRSTSSWPSSSTASSPRPPSSPQPGRSIPPPPPRASASSCRVAPRGRLLRCARLAPRTPGSDRDRADKAAT